MCIRDRERCSLPTPQTLGNVIVKLYTVDLDLHANIVFKVISIWTPWTIYSSILGAVWIYSQSWRDAISIRVDVVVLACQTSSSLHRISQAEWRDLKTYAIVWIKTILTYFAIWLVYSYPAKRKIETVFNRLVINTLTFRYIVPELALLTDISNSFETGIYSLPWTNNTITIL